MTTIRAFCLDDLAALSEIRRAAHPFDQDRMLALAPDAIRHELARPGIDPAYDVFVAESSDRRVVGFAYVQMERGQDDILGFCLAVHPDAREGDAGPRLLQAAWERALARRAKRRAQRAWFQAEVSAAATWLNELFVRGGLDIARYELRMQCSLRETSIPPLAMPGAVALRPYIRDNGHAVNAVLNEAFRDNWGSIELSPDEFAYLFDSNKVQPQVSVVAWAGDEVVGACLNDFSPTRFEQAGTREGWVSSLGVRPAWRGRGIATRILTWTLHQALARGLEAVALDVDAENPLGARRLYERVGFREAERFHVYRKPI